MDGLTIGRLAREAGVAIDTIRFYERQGLVPLPARSEAGYRLYPAAMVTRLRFIRRAKELGFSLKEIKELLAMRLDPLSTCAEVKNQAEGKIMEIEARIADLLRIKTALARLASVCRGRGPLDECPILSAMEERENEISEVGRKKAE
jgi:MerR family transcriptional regulator, copper efflux regulator